MHLTISTENLRRLAIFATWPQEALGEFEHRLDANVTHLRARRALRAAFEGAKHVSETDAADVLEAVVPLLVQYVGDGKVPVDVAEAVVSGIQREDTRSALKTTEELATLRTRLVAVLSNESLLLKAKATELVYERGRILNKTRIVSDLRPVFGAKDVEQVAALTVIHTLVLSYTEDAERKKLHIALDTADLEAMKDVVSRALDKQRALDAFAKATGIRKFDIL